MATVKRKLKLGLAQFAMQEDHDKNLSLAIKQIDAAAAKGADVVCLPELFTTPYFCTIEAPAREYSEAVPGSAGKVLGEAAKRNNVVLVAGSVYEDAGKLKFNTSMVFERDGTLLGTYRKIHIPHDPGFYEQNYFTPGDLGYKVFDTSAGKIAVLICYDQWFPEAARTVSLMGADMIFYPTAIGTVDGLPQSEGNWQEAWENVQRGHAIANGVIVAAVNRVGKEGSSNFWGGSFVSNAFGKTLVRGSDEEEILIADVDLDHGEDVKKGWRFFYNRRPETYSEVGAAKKVQK